MCNQACLYFVQQNIGKAEVEGKKVIEIGSRDVNGTLRPYIESLKPVSYVGVDFEPGPGVDVICRAEDSLNVFGQGNFDVLISTEMIEHVRDWRRIIHNFKNLLRPEGVLLMTTRSIGYPYHGYPFDFWRYEVDDIKLIFSDFAIERTDTDRSIPGVFLRARKPRQFTECDIAHHRLYSIIKDGRVTSISNAAIYAFHFRSIVRTTLGRVLPKKIRIFLKAKILKERKS